MLRILVFLICFGICASATAQKKTKSKSSQSQKIDEKYFSGMKYRSVGPTRGGRATAIAGIPSKPYTFYMGSTGGGVWKTEDAGTNWVNISDGQIKAGSIGAIEVALSDPNVIYVGTGSACPRGNISPGIGIFKSEDEGKTWKFSGLPEAGQIGKIVVHPKNPDIVWVSALGNIFRSNPERGVFRSKDGGQNWEKVLFISDRTGSVDLVINPANPRILCAAMWQVERKPWTLIDGGEEGGIYQSKDGGDTWNELEGGLPDGLLGRIGLAISPSNPDRLWAQIQAAEEEKGGLYRSDDGGKSWNRINRDHKLRQRGWYYSHITADPKNENTIYASNTGFYKSVDGGKGFERIWTPHGDNHGVWINPNDTDIMINCNDGGANVSLNGGKSWSSILNQPTSEFYRITVDNQFPYRLYAGQQDNTTISVPSRPTRSLTSLGNWIGVGGGESADVAVHPSNPEIIYAGTYSGEITYVNLASGEMRQVTPYPHYTEGTAQRDLKYRFQWNYPLFVSVHDPGEIYVASNYVHRSTDKGQTWEVISPDLTGKLDKYHDIPGGPIQHDATGVEVYSTIFALEESPYEKGTIWAGSDDGLIHITRDGGESWQNITPADMPVEGTVNKIEVSPHNPGRAIAAIYKYRDGDFKPYIFLTDDYGQSWSLLTTGANGIPDDHFVRAVAEDTMVKGLLYAGSEFGMYVSFDNGDNWQSLQLNLPHVPITDMETVNNDLAISTQGRSFWILDDLTPIQQARDATADNIHFLYNVRDTYRTNVGGWTGMNAVVNYYLEEYGDSDTITVIVRDDQDRIAQKWSTFPDEKSGEHKLKPSQGFNSLRWNLTYSAPRMVDNFVAMVFSAGREPGSKAVPGTYEVELAVGEWSSTNSFEVLLDPRWEEITISGLREKFELEQDVIDLINKSQDLIRNIRSIRNQATDIAKRAVDAGHEAKLKSLADSLDKKLSSVEDRLVQNKIETTQDEINFTRVFSNHIARLYQVIAYEHNAPTGGMLERWEDLQKQFTSIEAEYKAVVNGEFETFKAALEEADVERIIIKTND